MTPSLLASLLLATPTPPAPSAASEAWTEGNRDRIALVAGDEVVTVSDVRKQLIPYARGLQGSDADRDAAIRQAADDILRSLADRAIVLREFRESGKLTIPPAMVEAEIDDTVRRQFGGDRLRYYAALRAAGLTPAENRKQVEDRIIFEYMVGEVRRGIGEVSPARIQAYYEAHRAEFTRPEQVRFRQIAILRRAAESPEEARRRAEGVRATVTAIGTGAAEERFAAAAKASSDDDYRSAGGDSGWRDVSDLAGPVISALRGLKDGEVSPLLSLDAGGEKAHFILRREGFRAAGTMPIEEARAGIESRLREEMANQAVQSWLARLREKHAPEMR